MHKICNMRQLRPYILLIFVFSSILLFPAELCLNKPRAQADDEPDAFLGKIPIASAGAHEYAGKIGAIGFFNPYAIAINGTGHMYVMDSHRVLVFDAAGHFIKLWGLSGYDDGDFQSAEGIAINGSGFVYVTDTQNFRVQVFTQTGQFVRKWGSSGTGAGKFMYPRGIAINSTGHVYVADTNNNRIQVFDQMGNFVSIWNKTGVASGSGDGEFYGPQGIAVNSSGAVFIADNGNHRVQVLTQTGQFIAKWNKSDGSSGSGPGEFANPCGIAINGSGHVYVADTYNHRVQVFTGNGVHLRTWGAYGDDDGEFDLPMCVAINGSGDVAIADLNNHRIQFFNQLGTHQNTIGRIASGVLWRPTDVAINASGHVYVTDARSIQVFSPAGQFIRNWTTPGSPRGIAVNSTGHVYVIDDSMNRVYVYNATGDLIRQWGGYGQANGLFWTPCGIAINMTGHVYVADTYNHRVQVFTSAGAFVAKWNKTSGGSGSGPGEFSYPYDIAINASGNVYVLDSRVQVFTPAGTYIRDWSVGGQSVSINASGSVYVSGNNIILVYTATGSAITTFGAEGIGEGEFQAPYGIAFSPAPSTHMYVADMYNIRVQVFGNIAPVASAVCITTTALYQGYALEIAYSYADIDGDSPQAPWVRWYMNGIHQPEYDNTTSLPASVTIEGERWSVGILPYDGFDYGTEQVSAAVTIGGSASPTIDPFTILAACAIAGAVLVVVVVIMRKNKGKHGNASKKSRTDA